MIEVNFSIVNYSKLVLFFSIILMVSCTEKASIPEFYLNTDEELSWEEKQSCTLGFAENGDSLLLPGAFKLRGGSSSKYFKHSFSLELDDKFKLAGLPKDDDWILNANYIDKTFMRHKISYDLFREMGKHNIASKCAYVNLSLNDNYEGLYVLMEEINGGMVELDKGDSAAVIFKDPPIFYPEKLEYVQDTSNYYQQKYPKIYIHDKTAYLESFTEFLYNSSDEAFDAQLNDWVDLENVIDWHLLLLYTNNGDGILKNFYLYKKNAQTPFRFAIWDYDHSFGRDGDYEYNMMDRPLDCDRAILLKRLKERSSYRNRLKKRYWKLRESGIFSLEHFKELVSINDKMIEPHLKRNFEKWPVSSEWYLDDNTYEQEINLMYDFVELRLNQLDKRFEI